MIKFRSIIKQTIKDLSERANIPWAIVLELRRQFNPQEMTTRAAEIAFFTSLAIFPVSLFVMAVVGFMPELKLMSFLNYFKDFIPDLAYKLLSLVLVSMVTKRSVWIIIFSLFTAAWSLNKAVKAIIKGMNSAYKVKESRGYFKILFISMMFIIMLTLLVLITLFLIVFGDNIAYFIINIFNLSESILWVFSISRFILCIIVAIIGFNIFYLWAPNIKLGIKCSFPGAVITTVSWIIISYIYAYYTNNVAKTAEVYGPVAQIIILLTWVYFCSYTIILGYKYNAIKHFRRSEISQVINENLAKRKAK